jgi:hypothetical protein
MYYALLYPMRNQEPGLKECDRIKKTYAPAWELLLD